MPHVHKWISAFQRILFLFFGGWLGCATPFAVSAQAVDGVYLSPGRGFIVPHRPELRSLVTAHSTTGFAGFWVDTRQARKPKRWHGLYRYPQWGVELYYGNLGNTRELGHQLAAIAFLQVPSKRLSSRRISTSALWGMGMGYNTRVWDLAENPQGIALGSHVNICLTAGYSVTFALSDRLGLESGLRFTHFSNGALRLPNLGTNNLSAQVGFRYSLQQRTSPLPDEPVFTSELPKRAEFRVLGTIGMKQNLPPGGPNYLIHHLAAEYTHRQNWKHGWLVRLDGWYNTASAALINGETGTIDRLQSGLALGYRRHFGAASFDIHMGSYLFTRYSGNGMFYHRFQLSHRMGERLSASLGLTTHWARAHHPELGLGYRF